MGGLFAGVEDGLAAVVLAVGDGGLVSHLTGPDDDPADFGLTAGQIDAWREFMDPIEPILFVGDAAMPLLFQNGRTDQLVPEADGLAYQAAGPAHAERLWYDAGHALTVDARMDAAAFLGRHLGFDIASFRPPGSPGGV